MTSRLILTLAALLTLVACADTTPTAEPGLSISGEAEMGITGKL
ncbi:MAG: hypothetical protein Q7T25_11300 [Sideroxyarcus sp.]|nr:hypothetical protein [Sideroxyarcus sp.]